MVLHIRVGNSTLTTHNLSFDEGSEPIVCTPEHPFYILNAKADTPIVNFEGRDESKYDGQWVQAKYLKVGDKVLLSDGKTAILTKTELEHLSEPITTYNFEVQDFHTYYVGEQGILVHNDCLTDLQNKFESLVENSDMLAEYRKIDPNLEWGYKGSFKTGTVGNPNKATFGQRINLKNFDIDLYIKSDVLHAKYGSRLYANDGFRALLGRTTGFEGLRPGMKGFSIKFYPR